jgi:hypothetical protein
MEKRTDESPDLLIKERPVERRRGGRRTLIIFGIIAVVVVLALALGLGLGLGLKHHKNSTDSDSSNASQVVPTWRDATLDYALDMSWDLNAAPQDREYNFTATESTLAIDGVMRTVLTINGKYPGKNTLSQPC